MPKTLLVPLIITAVLSLTAKVADAESAAESFAQGEALLAKGEFAAALESFAAATRSDRENPEYLQHYALVRRVIELRTALPAEENPQRWELMAKALRAFYKNEGILSELLKQDQEIHARLGSAESAAMLAETQLALNQNADAITTLSGVDTNQATETTQALLGIALARSGQKERAQQIAAAWQLPEKASANLKYSAARLYAATGDTAKSNALLKACFEATLPSRLEAFKAHAKACPDFAAMVATPEFAGVLETKSLMPESKCSGGGSCAGCPMKGKCSGNQANQEK